MSYHYHFRELERLLDNDIRYNCPEGNPQQYDGCMLSFTCVSPDSWMVYNNETEKGVMCCAEEAYDAYIGDYSYPPEVFS